jgi:hypothetical protein
MSDPWIHVGAPVLVASGPFQGFEGAVDSIDPAADLVVIKLELFGRTVPLTFPLSSASDYVTPFGDQPTTLLSPNADICGRELLAQYPEANATYRTDCWRSTTQAFVQVSQSDSGQRLIVRSHNLTWPCREKMMWSVREVPLTDSDWMTFSALIEGCRFWQLPYDNGRRIPRKGNRWRWWLEGYKGGRYHAVVRATGEPQSEISACCEYLRALAVPALLD